MITFLLSFGLFAKIAAAFGVASSAVGGLALFGWLGPFAPVVAAVGKLIKTVIGWLWEAFQLACSHPAVWALVFLGYAGGRWHQHSYDHHVIEAAKINATTLQKKIEGASDVDAAKAKAAIAAREAAKSLPLFEPPGAVIGGVPPPTKPAETHPVADAKPDGLRDGNKVRRRPKCESLFCP